jgi:hypothetical protein
MTDPNGNRTEVALDALGRVTALAVKGKSGGSDGDTIADPTVAFEYFDSEWLTNAAPNYVHASARTTCTRSIGVPPMNAPRSCRGEKSLARSIARAMIRSFPDRPPASQLPLEGCMNRSTDCRGGDGRTRKRGVPPSS